MDGGRELRLGQLRPGAADLLDLDLRSEYTAATGRAVRPERLEFYQLRWDLTEIAVCLDHFRGPHGSTDDDREHWQNLTETIERRPS